MKSADAIAIFKDDDEMKKAIAEIKGGTPTDVNFDV